MPRNCGSKLIGSKRKSTSKKKSPGLFDYLGSMKSIGHKTNKKSKNKWSF